MKPVLVSIAMISLATAAMAQPGATTLTMTCAAARRIVASQGAAVLRTGPMTYDRYVRDSSFCALQETARPAWVRTADAAQCPVGGVCHSVEIDNGRRDRRSRRTFRWTARIQSETQSQAGGRPPWSELCWNYLKVAGYASV